MIISVASGKGGIGKTTVATNLALSIGSNVQLLDCDVEELNPDKPELKIEDWILNICGILSILFCRHRQKNKNQIIETPSERAANMRYSKS